MFSQVVDQAVVGVIQMLCGARLTGSPLLQKCMSLMDVIFPHYFYFPFIAYMILLDSKSGGSLALRAAVVSSVWVVGTAIYRLYFVACPSKPQWVEDLFAVAGLATASVLTLVMWSHFGFGDVIPRVTISGLAVAMTFMAISPFWNVSGHVAFTTLMTGLLVLSNPAWIVLTPLPLIMIFNRVFLKKHTLAESAGGFVLGVAGVLLSTLI